MSPTAVTQKGLYPGKFVYDEHLLVCWLADANRAGKPAMQPLFNVSGINPNGSMNFQTAQNRVAALNAHGYLGHNNWQIPVTR